MKVNDHDDATDLDELFYFHEIQELEQKNSDLQDRLNECSQERDTFRVLLDEKEDLVKQSEESLRALRTEHNKYLEINNNLTAQLERFIDNQKNNSDEIRYLKEQLESLSTENKRLKEVQIDYETIRNENNTLNDQLSSLRDNNSNEISKLKDQLESENEKLKKVQNDYVAENNNLKDQLSSFRTENKKLRNGQKNDSSEIRDLKAQLESLSSEYERLNKVQANLSTTLRTESANLKKVTNDYEVMCGEHDKLKIHLENEKLKNKNSKQNNHSTIYIDNVNLKVQMKDCKKTLSILRSEKEVLTNQLAELVAENEKLKDKVSDTSSKISDNYSAIRNENDKLKAQLKQFEDKLKEKSQKYDQLISDIRVKNSEFQKKSYELEQILAQNIANNENVSDNSLIKDSEIRQIQYKDYKNEEYVKEINDLKNLLQRKEKERQELIEKNANFKKEASQYRSALGAITNYRIDDDDENYFVPLKNNIEELQNKLKNYVTTLKGDFEVDFKAVNNLMEKYNIKTKVTPKEPNKPLVKAVLQHHIIKTITKDIRKYFKYNLKEGSIMNLEKEIATMAKDLENKLAWFSKTRSGDDIITQAASIKVRQEVNIALVNRGFSDVLSSENYTSHGYIIMKTTELNREMNTYRTIKDVQEPSAQMRWIKTESSIDPSIMEGNWDKDDIDNLEVEICSFPMIGRDLEDVEKRKIYTHAQIFIKRKKFITKGIDYLTSKKAKVHLELESDDDEIL
ncbi:unnamed protein product [Rhizophagus irregularis]|nr:unnamed protein product [Rhizophagus irregularis]